jgi:hypothetical protein
MTSDEELVARREISFELAVEGEDEDLPRFLRLSADMTHMDHGPTLCELLRDGRSYRGTIVFVMGGSWELEIYDGDTLALSGQIHVREN